MRTIKSLQSPVTGPLFRLWTSATPLSKSRCLSGCLRLLISPVRWLSAFGPRLSSYRFWSWRSPSGVLSSAMSSRTITEDTCCFVFSLNCWQTCISGIRCCIFWKSSFTGCLNSAQTRKPSLLCLCSIESATPNACSKLWSPDPKFPPLSIHMGSLLVLPALLTGLNGLQIQSRRQKRPASTAPSWPELRFCFCFLIWLY